jgi:hypothetical protein
MYEKAKGTGRVQGCREIVNFISQSSSALLKIENKVPQDLGNALMHFKDSLVTKSGLTVHFHNVGVSDSVVDLIVRILNLLCILNVHI